MAPLVARAGIGVLVAVLGFGMLSAQKDVAFVIDGEVDHRTSHAATVGDFLQRAGVTVGPGDVLTPDAATTLADGMRVQLVRAPASADGDQWPVTVAALRLDQVRGASRHDRGRPSRFAPAHRGAIVEVAVPVPVTVTVDGTDRQVITGADSVAAVLAEIEVRLGAHDRVTPASESRPQAGMRILVQRVRVTTETRQEAIGFDTVEHPTDDLPPWERREARAGQEGVREIDEEVVRVDGAEESRVRTGERVVREPQDRIVEVGTAPPPPPPPSEQQPPAEATGNVQEGQASRYATRFAGEPTASGEPYDPDALTAAHRSLPMGTRVTVTNLANGSAVTVRINDRGPFVEGRIIDLSQAAFDRISSRGTGVIDVRLEW